METFVFKIVKIQTYVKTLKNFIEPRILELND